MTDYGSAALMGLERVTHPDSVPYLYQLSKTSRSELAESAANAVLDALTKNLGTEGWSIATDGDNEPTVWRTDPARPDYPIAVISESGAGPELWSVLAALLPEMAVVVTTATDVETRSDHTPVAVAQEVQRVLVSAGLDIRSVAVSTHIGAGTAHASVMTVGARHYSTAESDRLADYLGLDVTYSEHGNPGERIASLDGKTRTGLSVTIYCEPRMTAEEVAAEASGG